MALYFQNKNNNYIEKVSNAGVLVFFLGPLYFAFRGIWSHFIIGIFLSLLTFGLSWVLIYPFIASSIVQKHYLRNGWVEIPESDVNQKDLKSTFKEIISGVIIFITFIVAIWIAMKLSLSWYVAFFPVCFVFIIPEILSEKNEDGYEDTLKNKILYLIMTFIFFCFFGFLLYHFVPSELLNWWQSIIGLLIFLIFIPSAVITPMAMTSAYDDHLLKAMSFFSGIMSVIFAYFLLIYITSGINILTGELVIPIQDHIWWKDLLFLLTILIPFLSSLIPAIIEEKRRKES